MTNPYDWHITSDHDGFFIVDEDGGEIVPNCLPFNAGWRTQSFKTAEEVMHEQISAALDLEDLEESCRRGEI